jgi:hypothetical protein
VFPEPRFDSKINSLEVDEEMTKSTEDSSKVYKIIYTMNLLPCFGKHFVFDDIQRKWVLVKDDVPIVQIISESEEFNIFKTESLKNFIEYKWGQIGRNHHLYGVVNHCFYLLALGWYTNKCYIEVDFPDYYQYDGYKGMNDLKSKNLYSMIFIICMIYPVTYSFFQAKHTGFLSYFLDPVNISHILFNVIGSVNAVFHYNYSPFFIWGKITMVASIFMTIAKTVQLLRIIRSFSPLVTMMSKVFFEF